MIGKILRMAFVATLVIGMAACKKNNSEPASPNEIIVSVNNFPYVHYTQATYNQATEANRPHENGFCRSNYTDADNLADQHNFIEFDSFDSNLFTQTLPYSVKTRFVYINLIDGSYYSFDNRAESNNKKGHLNLTITYAKDKRIKGTYDGVVYYPGDIRFSISYSQRDSISIKGTFDILTPPYNDY